MKRPVPPPALAAVLLAGCGAAAGKSVVFPTDPT
jgi:hypothetical protein